MYMQIKNAFNNCLLAGSQKETNTESAISKIALKIQEEYPKTERSAEVRGLEF